MSELSKLVPQAVIHEIKGLKFKIKPLNVGDMVMISDLDNDEKRPKALRGLIEKVIKDSFPDATKEEIDELPYDVVNELVEKIAEINDLRAKKKS